MALQPILMVVISFYSTMTLYYGSPADIATLYLGGSSFGHEGGDLATTVQLNIGAGQLECDITVTLDTIDGTASRTHTDHPTHSLLLHMLSSLFLFTAAPEDYIALTAVEFTFSAGSFGDYIPVTVFTNIDDVVEGDEILTLQISDFTGPVVLGNPIIVTLTIFDIDSKHYLLCAYIRSVDNNFV